LPAIRFSRNRRTWASVTNPSSARNVVQVVTVEASQKRRGRDIPGSVYLRIDGDESAIDLTPDEARKLSSHLLTAAKEAEIEAPVRRINLED
jgi:hypothetical protein